MSANNPQHSSEDNFVKVTDWSACYNSGEGIIALSCTVTCKDSSASITGVGLILNTSDGVTLISAYTGSAAGSESVFPAINVPQGNLRVGGSVMGVVQGECHGHHYFFEQELTITNC